MYLNTLYSTLIKRTLDRHIQWTIAWQVTLRIQITSSNQSCERLRIGRVYSPVVAVRETPYLFRRGTGYSETSRVRFLRYAFLEGDRGIVFLVFLNKEMSLSLMPNFDVGLYNNY